MIAAVGGTFVILSGSGWIDLSVAGIIALTGTASAALLRAGCNPWIVMLLMLVMGVFIGSIMGSLVTFLKVHPFIATLAFLWIGRGLCFFISDVSIPIYNPIYELLSWTKILIPGLSNPVTKEGAYISLLVVLVLVVYALAIYIAHYTRFGRTVYAIGGNEQSARLMGLRVNATKVGVYALTGFFTALAGLALSIYLASGHGYYAYGFELTVIATVVIGGTMLTGGAGYLFGTLFGAIIIGVIQTLIQFNGNLSSWWTKIVIGMLLLLFIGIQSIIAARKARALASEKRTRTETTDSGKRKMSSWKIVLIIVSVVIVISVGIFMLVKFIPLSKGTEAGSVVAEPGGRILKPYRQDQAALLVESGAVLVYERNGGFSSIDELYAIYPDGRIVGDNTTDTIEKQVTAEEVEKLLSDITNRGWFTTAMYDTWHVQSEAMYGYYITVSYEDQVKTVKAVDGGTDAPADYWQVVSLINGVIPQFTD